VETLASSGGRAGGSLATLKSRSKAREPYRYEKFKDMNGAGLPGIASNYPGD